MPSNNTRTSCYLTSVTFKYLKHDYRQYSTIRSHYNYKSVLSLVPRLSTWRCPQLARRRQLSIDICRPRPSYGNQLRVAAAFDRRDRQTDRRTDTAPLRPASTVNVPCTCSTVWGVLHDDVPDVVKTQRHAVHVRQFGESCSMPS